MLTVVRFEQAIFETKQIGEPEPVEHTINVDGEGRVTVVPDIATLSLGVETRGESVETAQGENTRVMNNMIEQVKAVGVVSDDLQTVNYNVREDRRWNPETQDYDSLGWVVSQTLEVTLRDVDLVPEVLSVAGKNGVTNVNGPNFRVDDPESQMASARKEAVADAKEKAEAIAEALGVELDGVVAYDEFTGGPPVFRAFSTIAESADAEVVPEIETGTEELKLNVNITYRITD